MVIPMLMVGGVEDVPTAGRNKKMSGVCVERLCLLKGVPGEREVKGIPSASIAITQTCDDQIASLKLEIHYRTMDSGNLAT
jgi:hypothetical protein